MGCMRWRTLVLVLSILAFAPAVAEGQLISTVSGHAELSREGLDSLLVSYEETAASSVYSQAIREQARREAELIRSRLAEGDFRVGDQIQLVVEGEQELTNTFVVQAGPAIILPRLGSISLRGVLRSELQDHLRTEIGRYIRNPSVQARSFVRLVITGSVASAGFHVVPINSVFSDVLMVAGGPSGNADLKEIRIEREDRVIWEGAALQQAIIEGRTLDQLSLRAGDEIVVPTAGRSGWWGGVRSVVTTVGPIASLIVILTRVF